MKINNNEQTDCQFDTSFYSTQCGFEEEGTPRLTTFDLLNGGYQRVLAFIPINDARHKSANAERVRKSRGRKREAGIRQLNIQVPDDKAVRDTFKAVAAAVLDGTVSSRRLAEILADDTFRTECLVQCGRVLDRGGWRGVLLRLVIRL